VLLLLPLQISIVGKAETSFLPGVKIPSLAPSSLAAQSGLQGGDVIVRVGDVDITADAGEVRLACIKVQRTICHLLGHMGIILDTGVNAICSAMPAPPRAWASCVGEAVWLAGLFGWLAAQWQGCVVGRAVWLASGPVAKLCGWQGCVVGWRPSGEAVWLAQVTAWVAVPLTSFIKDHGFCLTNTSLASQCSWGNQAAAGHALMGRQAVSEHATTRPCFAPSSMQNQTSCRYRMRTIGGAPRMQKSACGV